MGSLLNKISVFLSIKDIVISDTSNGGCRREEKSRKHWSVFTMLLFLVAEIFLFVRSNQKQFVYIDCTENHRKIGPSQMS